MRVRVGREGVTRPGDDRSVSVGEESRKGNLTFPHLDRVDHRQHRTRGRRFSLILCGGGRGGGRGHGGAPGV